jgi:hypothetical protein
MDERHSKLICRWKVASQIVTEIPSQIVVPIMAEIPEDTEAQIRAQFAASTVA